MRLGEHRQLYAAILPRKTPKFDAAQSCVRESSNSLMILKHFGKLNMGLGSSRKGVAVANASGASTALNSYFRSIRTCLSNAVLYPFRQIGAALKRRQGDFYRRLMFQQLERESFDLPPLATDSAVPSGIARVRTEIDELISEARQRRALSWTELFQLEALLLRSAVEQTVRQRVWRLREEFRRLATADLFDSYQKNSPPQPTDPDFIKVAADAADLLDEIHRLRAGRRAMDKIRAFFTISILTLSVTLIVWLMHLTKEYYVGKGMAPAKIVMIAGMFGGVFSLLLRLSKLPDKGDLLDRSQSFASTLLWVCSPLLSIVEGMLGALILYVLFQTPLLAGIPFFPDLQPRGPRLDEPMLYQVILDPPPLSTLAEGAKIFIWCFLAGFSERLVPDLLSQVQSTAERRGEGKSIKP